MTTSTPEQPEQEGLREKSPELVVGLGDEFPAFGNNFDPTQSVLLPGGESGHHAQAKLLVGTNHLPYAVHVRNWRSNPDINNSSGLFPRKLLINPFEYGNPDWYVLDDRDEETETRTKKIGEANHPPYVRNIMEIIVGIDEDNKSELEPTPAELKVLDGWLLPRKFSSLEEERSYIQGALRTIRFDLISRRLTLEISVPRGVYQSKGVQNYSKSQTFFYNFMPFGLASLPRAGALPLGHPLYMGDYDKLGEVKAKIFLEEGERDRFRKPTVPHGKTRPLVGV